MKPYKVFFLTLILIIVVATNSFSMEINKQELIEIGSIAGNVKLYHPELSILEVRGYDSFSVISLGVVGEYYNNIVKAIDDARNDMVKKALLAAKDNCSNKFSDEKQIFYGLSNQTFNITMGEIMVITYISADAFCGKLQ